MDDGNALIDPPELERALRSIGEQPLTPAKRLRLFGPDQRGLSWGEFLDRLMLLNCAKTQRTPQALRREPSAGRERARKAHKTRSSSWAAKLAIDPCRQRDCDPLRLTHGRMNHDGIGQQPGSLRNAQ